MDSVPQENVFDELNNFEKKRSQDVPPVLEDFLNKLAKTGDPMFPWPKVKPLIVHKMEKVFTEFHEFCPTDDLPPCPNVENFDYVNMRKKLIEKIESFSSAPFTIQRLCELITAARKHYKRTDKFMRAVEKTILVVSTIEPYFQSKREDLVSSPLLNGSLDGSNSDSAPPPAPTSPSPQQEVESSQQNDLTAETDVKSDTVPNAAENADPSETDVISSSREECETSGYQEEPDAKAQNEPTLIAEAASTCYTSGSEESAYEGVAVTQHHDEAESGGTEVAPEVVSTVTTEKPEAESSSNENDDVGEVNEDLPETQLSSQNDSEVVHEGGNEEQICHTADLKCKEFLAFDNDPIPETNDAVVESSSPTTSTEVIPTEFNQEIAIEAVDGAAARIGSEESAIAMDTDPGPATESSDGSKSPDSSTISCLDGEAMCAEVEPGNVADQSEPMDQD